jgi:hypothetical protein
MTPVKPQISKLQDDKILSSWALTCYGCSIHKRLLSESSRPYMLAYYLSAFIYCAYFSVANLEEKT